ncbi:hypothetical protein [Delftia acidovorans]|jgi:hypothetical protein|uniref:hypothetical protein n=1 Tax=Delftia acidovorans TaxID=80866 RepID=UPI000F8451CB|nr:hypothetical protein [Delftia acidovorans]
MRDTTQKLCKNCIHYHRTSTGRFDDRCKAPHQGTDPVNGKPLDKACEFERDPFKSGDRCGPQALHYVPRIASAASTTASESALTP